MHGQRLWFELLWLIIAVLVATVVLLPPTLNVGLPVYWLPNALVIIGFVTAIRLLFFPTQTPWLRPRPAKGIAVIVLVPVALGAILFINDIQTLVDAAGDAAVFGDVAALKRSLRWGRYVRNESVFFGSGLLICSVLLPVILIISLWRQVKAGEKAI